MTIKLNDATIATAELVKPLIKIDANGVASIDDNEWLEAVRGDVSVEELKRVHDMTSNAVHATSLAFGEVATEHLKKNKDMNSVSGSVNLGKDKIEFGFERSKTYPGMVKDGVKGDDVVKHGILTTKYVAQASNNVGELKRVKGVLAERMAELAAK